MPTSPQEQMHDFFFYYGMFMTSWYSFELVVEIAIMHELRLTPEEAHITLGGLGFGAKINILYSLLHRAEAANGQRIKKLREAVQTAERNALTHSFVQDVGWTEFTFAHRNVKQKFKTRKKNFSPDEFRGHVLKFNSIVEAIQMDFNISEDCFQSYGQRSLSLR